MTAERMTTIGPGNACPSLTSCPGATRYRCSVPAARRPPALSLPAVPSRGPSRSCQPVVPSGPATRSCQRERSPATMPNDRRNTVGGSARGVDALPAAGGLAGGTSGERNLELTTHSSGRRVVWTCPWDERGRHRQEQAQWGRSTWRPAARARGSSQRLRSWRPKGHARTAPSQASRPPPDRWRSRGTAARAAAESRIGKLVRRMPSKAYSAPATAEAVGTSTASPMPLAP